MRISLEWSLEAIYLSIHQFELIHNKIVEKNNRINSLLRKFSYFCWLWQFCPSINLVFRLTYTQFKMYSRLKTHILTKSINFSEKKLKNRKYIFHKRDKKIMKHFSEKKIKCDLRRPWETSAHTKTFFGNFFSLTILLFFYFAIF